MGLMDATARPGMGLRERLCAALRDAMRSGTLAAGARLPATRVLAQDLTLSRVTVEAAYAQLEAEGYVVRRTGQGSFVGAAGRNCRSTHKAAQRSKGGTGAHRPVVPPRPGHGGHGRL